MADNTKNNMVDKEVFDTFFRENYCEVDYDSVKNEFEEVAACGLEYLFTEGTPFERLTEKNFVVYLRSSVYGEFEAILEEAFDTINPEIMDAVMDLSVTSSNEDELTAIYWETCEELLKKFLKELFKTRISKMMR